MPENSGQNWEFQVAPQKNPLHLPPIILLSYMKESMLATTSIELRNMRQIKKRFWQKMKKPFEIKGPNYVLILAYLDPKSKKMKILIFGVKIFQHIYPPLNPNAMSFTKSVFPLFLAYQGKDIVFRVIYRV